MTRADDLQAALDEIPYGEPVVASVGTCLRAIPDLLAVVRAAQDALEPLGLDAQPRTELALVRAGLIAALAAFEDGAA